VSPPWPPALVNAACALGAEIARAESVPGGSIAAAWRVELADRRVVFVKTGYAQPAQFAAEADGLRELAPCRAIRTPRVLAEGEDFLALEFVLRGPPERDFSTRLGRGLAELHRRTATQFGHTRDNFIGATPQRNTPALPREAGWAAFFWEYRLLPQWQRAEASGLAGNTLTRRFLRLEARVAELLGAVKELPVLLHGDLWGGNVIADSSGAPVLLDPAVYYGHRETDLAMMRLFGGIPDRAFKAYLEIFPVPAGAEERQGLYDLYHMLNHWNLFGAGYGDAVLALLNRYGR
jgi:fructosamine-3-kinase